MSQNVGIFENWISSILIFICYKICIIQLVEHFAKIQWILVFGNRKWHCIYHFFMLSFKSFWRVLHVPNILCNFIIKCVWYYFPLLCMEVISSVCDSWHIVLCFWIVSKSKHGCNVILWLLQLSSICYQKHLDLFVMWKIGLE